MIERNVPLSIEWVGDVEGYLKLLDQTQLPGRLDYVECRSPAAVRQAIQMLQVRGAPAIGVAAAYGVCLADEALDQADPDRRLDELERVLGHLATSRPTAVNLIWALDRLRQRAVQMPRESTADMFRRGLLDEARRIHAEDREICREIGRQGATLLTDGDTVLTHCNTGGLAASQYGTALSVIFTAHDQGKRVQVFVDETRPLLQGARLTAWELMQYGVPATLICDSVAAQVMKEGRIHSVWVGADRIVANGDAANKIGTYGLAVLARAHDIPFYVAAPTSTFDVSLASGDDIPIEQRADEEVTQGFGRRTAPAGIGVYNPAFDVTPAELITAIVTQRGVLRPVEPAEVRRMITPVSNSTNKDR